ncbi:YhbY family RNA-binding protein, partial [Enterococcus faecium]|uniref:YhbY family RNA-binding protein n=1 Tax=Enterococcus faecium TaxID=1352 RepID=UPI001EE99199
VFAGLGWITVTAPAVIAGWAPKGVDLFKRKKIKKKRRKIMSLRGKQKRFLRSKAHHLQPIFQIGKGGINSAMIVQIDEALEKRDL